MTRQVCNEVVQNFEKCFSFFWTEIVWIWYLWLSKSISKSKNIWFLFYFIFSSYNINLWEHVMVLSHFDNAFWILVSFRLSLIWLRSAFIFLYNIKLKTDNKRLKQTSIQNALLFDTFNFWNTLFSKTMPNFRQLGTMFFTKNN